MHEIIESSKPHVRSHVGLTRQSWGADFDKARSAGTGVSFFVWIGVVVKISHRLGIKEYQGRTPHVSQKRVLDLDEVSLSPPPRTSEGP